MEAVFGLVIGSVYKITCWLGGGAYGQTYLAEKIDNFSSRKYVIKQFKPINNPLQPVDRQDAINRFKQEAEALSMLGQDDRIPAFVDFIEENNQLYIIQEFIDGESLDDVLGRREILPELVVVFILKYLLETLRYVHRKNIIHRDIKPSNIILRRIDLKPVLIDFGAIKNIEISTSRSRSRTVAIGTQDYMPNEQANGSPRLCSDIYSLGMVTLKALLGYIPEEDYQTGEIYWENPCLIKPGLAEILMKMTRSHFRDRYPSAEEALQALNGIINTDELSTFNKKHAISIKFEEKWKALTTSLYIVGGITLFFTLFGGAQDKSKLIYSLVS